MSQACRILITMSLLAFVEYARVGTPPSLLAAHEPPHQGFLERT